MRQLALEFVGFWKQETFSKKLWGMILIVLAQLWFLLLVSYTGSEEHIFGQFGYEVTHFMINRFLGITSFFFPLALMYWGYAWFLKKKNSGEVVRELFLLFGVCFSFNMLILNGFFLDTEWAGLFPRFFHAIVYFIFDGEVGKANVAPFLLESFLFFFFVFNFFKSYFKFSYKELFLKIKKLVRKMSHQFLKQKSKDKSQLTKPLDGQNEKERVENGISRFLFKKKWWSLRSRLIKSIEWDNLRGDQRSLLEKQFLIKVAQPEIDNQGTDGVQIDFGKFGWNEEREEKSFSKNFERKLTETEEIFEKGNGENKDVIDISQEDLFQEELNNSLKTPINSTSAMSIKDIDVGKNESEPKQPKVATLEDTLESDSQYPLPSIINYEDGDEEKRAWLANEANLVFSKKSQPSKDAKQKIEQIAQKLEDVIAQFGIKTNVVKVSFGPVITQYELTIEPGIKVSKIIGLSDNIALALAAQSIRIVAPIPGKEVIGIEVPNQKREMVTLRDIVDSGEFKKSDLKLPLALGAAISGEPIVTDLSLTPHLLVAGATGSGKSVCINSIIVSLLLKRSPLDVRLIMVDPKMVELNIYNGIPHLLAPVITDHKKASWVLRWAISEMETRYRLLEQHSVRNISGYNDVVKKNKKKYEQKAGSLPYIVIVIDEFADLMMVAKKEIEASVNRLAAMSRAVGIHLLLATQRPSVDVITGVIKANFPSRIAFQVSSQVDSKTIIGSVGAEKLLGRGDLLYQDVSSGNPQRIQGAFLTDEEVKEVVEGLKKIGKEDYLTKLLREKSEEVAEYGEEDEFFNQALEIAMSEKKISASYLQRRLQIGYNRAAKIVEQMEERNIVGKAIGSKPREVLI